MSCKLKFFKLVLLCCMTTSWAAAVEKIQDNVATVPNTSDLQASATSAKLFNLGGLLGYGNSGYYPNYNRPGNYPSIGNYPNTGYYPNNNYYPNSGWTGGNYPTTNGGGYYPTNTYYPTTSTGTNILGGSNGGYGGYGGNGGFRQYSGYLNPNYEGQRNRGYGYYTNTDLYGLPKTNSDRYGGSRERDRVPYSFRGYE